MKKRKVTDVNEAIAIIIKANYETYLNNSEDQTTSDIREDAFINGFAKGVELFNTIKEKSNEEAPIN
jgi:hypothetical protein